MNWQEIAIDTFTIYYQKNTIAEENIEEIIKKEAQCIDKVCRFLRVDKAFRLNVYLYPSMTLKKKYMGGSSPGSSNYKTKSVGYVYNKRWIKNIATCHEETHIYCMLWGGKQVELEGKLINSLPGLYEGLAMYTQSILYYEYFYRFEQVPPPKGMTINQSIISDISQNKAPDVFNVLMYNGYCKNLTNGAQLGSIVGFIIDTYGLPVFKKIYLYASEDKKLNENIRVFEEILKKTAKKINEDWKAYVRQHPHFKL
ncbi:MAG: hypothetical protein ABID04_01250 [Patescibacteria group bacterium]